MPHINLNVTGTLYEAIGIRNREEAGKRKISQSGSIDIPGYSFDHDYRLEDSYIGVALVNNLRYRRHETCVNLAEVVPNYNPASDPTSGSYTIIQHANNIINDGFYYNNFKFKWLYGDNTLPVSTNNINMRSNGTSHGLLDYNSSLDLVYTYPNIGLVLEEGCIVYMVWVNNSAGFGWGDHIFVVQSGNIQPYYGFYYVSEVINSNSIRLLYSSTSVLGPHSYFNNSDAALFDNTLGGFPANPTVNNHAIIYDFGVSGPSLGHYLGVTGYENTVSSQIRTYNDQIMFWQSAPTLLNDGTVSWEDQKGSPDRMYVLMAFLAPVGNYLDFSFTGSFYCEESSGTLGSLSMTIKLNPVGMTPYFTNDLLNDYESKEFFNTPSVQKFYEPNMRYNFKIPTRGFPIVLARLISEIDAIATPAWDIRPGFYPYDLTHPFSIKPPQITLNSVDCRRRI